ncbi:MAG: hypothetical protein ACRERD_11935 [Candidatus Binatia bacterium]
MRKIILVSAIGFPLLFLLSVYAIPPSFPTWTVRLKAAHGLRVGDGVEEAGRRIGQVVGVEPYKVPGSAGTDVLIVLEPGSHDRVRERSAFFVTRPEGSARPILSLIVFDEHSPPLPPGSQVAGAESQVELELRRQLATMEGAVRGLSQQLGQATQALEKASRSEERARLEKSMGGLADTLQQSRNDLIRVLTQEMARWKKLYDKVVPPEKDKPMKFSS